MLLCLGLPPLIAGLLSQLGINTSGLQVFAPQRHLAELVRPEHVMLAVLRLVLGMSNYCASNASFNVRRFCKFTDVYTVHNSVCCAMSVAPCSLAHVLVDVV